MRAEGSKGVNRFQQKTNKSPCDELKNSFSGRAILKRILESSVLLHFSAHFSTGTKELFTASVPMSYQWIRFFRLGRSGI